MNFIGRLINKLLEAEGKNKVHVQKKVASMFVAYTNIEAFNNGCLQYGLAKEFLVQSADLWEGRKGPFLNVINCLHSLGFLVSIAVPNMKCVKRDSASSLQSLVAFVPLFLLCSVIYSNYILVCSIMNSNF